MHRETERLLRISGLKYSVVRAGLYGEFFARWLVEAARKGVLRLPIQTGRVSLVSRADVSHSLAAAARCANGGPHLITGSRTYDLGELAAMTEELTQRPVNPAGCSDRDFGSQLLQEGTSPSWAYAFITMFQSVREHRYELVTGHLTQLTGRTPALFCDVAHWALAAASARGCHRHHRF